MISVKDPLTGSTIRWSSHPQALGYTMPLSAAVNERSAGRRWAVPEHPDCAVLFDGKICVASAGWDAISMQLRRFDAATLAFVDMLQIGQFGTGAHYVENRQIPTAHRIPQVAATASNLYFIANGGLQGAQNTYYLRRLAAGSSAFVSPTNLDVTKADHWVGAAVPTVGGSALTSSYYYGCRVIRRPAGAERVLIPALWNTADGKAHAAVAYSDDLYTKGNSQAALWTFAPVVNGNGASKPVMGHLAAYSNEDGSASMLVGVVTQLYCMAYLNVVYSEDGGTTWKVAGVDEADYDVPVGGLVCDHAELVARRLMNDTNKTFSVQRVVYDAVAQKAYVSLLIATGRGYLNGRPTSDDAACYILEIDLSARATTGCTQTLHGPFLASPLRNFANGIQLIDEDANNLLGIVAMPVAAVNPGPGYIDCPDGGPTLNVYRIPKATVGTFATWTLVQTIGLPAGGSPYPYRDAVVENIIHEWGYGDGQIFNGVVPVDGRSDVVAALVGDQRVTGAHQCYHMGRLVLLEVGS